MQFDNIMINMFLIYIFVFGNYIYFL